MKIIITNAKTGEKTAIVRDVCTTHPQWVHDQCGTASESELQHCLDTLNVSDWYRDEKHLGDDVCGISMFDSAPEKRTMTEAEATEWVRSHSDDDQLEDDQLEAAFAAIFEREADDEDRAQGLWSHLCAAVEVE